MHTPFAQKKVHKKHFLKKLKPSRLVFFGFLFFNVLNAFSQETSQGVKLVTRGAGSIENLENGKRLTENKGQKKLAETTQFKKKYFNEGMSTKESIKVLSTSVQSSNSKNIVSLANTGVYPPPIATMILRGKNVNVLDVFEASSGLTGFVMSAEKGERRLYYVTSDAAVAIYGMIFDPALNNITARDFAKYTNPLSETLGVGTLKPAPEKIKTLSLQPSVNLTSEPRQALDSSKKISIDDLKNQKKLVGNSSIDLWSSSALDPELKKPIMVEPITAWTLAVSSKNSFIEGSGLPIYIVFDPACAYCHKTYHDTRKLLGKFQIHWIPVAALGVRSQMLMETLFRSPDKATAMALMASKELPAAQFLSIDVATLVNENSEILKQSGTKSIPLILFQENGQSRQMTGAPGDVQIKELLRVAKSANRKEDK